jgi:hypothetical protein
MPVDAYNETMAHASEPLRQSEGFISHAAQITPDGVTVTEVLGDPRAAGALILHLGQAAPSPAAPKPTVTKLHNALAR